MTNTTVKYAKGDFKVGVEYKVKFEGDSRFATRTFQGTHTHYMETESGEIIPSGQISAHFNGRGGGVFCPYEEIISATEVDQTKKKAKKPTTCNRCYGAGKFQHVAHVQGGICFKCNGSGLV